MNQENNQFNSNNYSSQGNNGSLNNQSTLNNNFAGRLQQNNTNIYQQPNVIQNNQENLIQPNYTPSNNKPPKPKKLGLIIGIVVGVIIIGIIATIIGTNVLKSKVNDKLNEELNDVTGNTEDTSKEEEKTDYEAEWNDFIVYIHGVEFKFPMTFQEFESKIASTKYELYYKSDREKSIYSSIMDRNQITYIYQVREHSLSQNGLAYKLYIHLQNLEEETQPAYNTMVVGIETETIAYGVDIDERGFDDNLYFTKKKLHIGQNMTKSKLEKTFGRGNSWIEGSNKYGAGNYTSGFYKFAKFQCNMNDDGRITKLILKNYIEEEE